MNRQTYLLKLKTPALPAPRPDCTGKPPEKCLSLMDQWRRVVIKNTSRNTDIVAAELQKIIDNSPYRGEARIKETFGNLGIVGVELNDARHAEILALLNTHPAVKPHPLGVAKPKPPQVTP